MVVLKQGKSKDGKLMHYSVGALIKKDGKYLLIDRVQPPFGFAGLAGHVDDDEEAKKALKREIEEESGLKIDSHKLLFEEELGWNWCTKGVGVHYWYLYECEVLGETKRNFFETKSIGWYNRDEIKKLKLEPVWEYWFKKLKII